VGDGGGRLVMLVVRVGGSGWLVGGYGWFVGSWAEVYGGRGGWVVVVGGGGWWVMLVVGGLGGRCVGWCWAVMSLAAGGGDVVAGGFGGMLWGEPWSAP